MDQPILEMRGIAKTFPGVRALDDVNIALYPGKVTALIGENGAGKSTLVKILTGIYQPDEGEILIDGEPVHLATA
ncbi:sugar ABC transporter ATP-binding protein [Brucella sp. 10RB9215]|nr:sugar ABC transporter ATP-binding protein [Brucella sp. 10RB9215]